MTGPQILRASTFMEWGVLKVVGMNKNLFITQKTACQSTHENEETQCCERAQVNSKISFQDEDSAPGLKPSYFPQLMFLYLMIRHKFETNTMPHLQSFCGRGTLQ